MCLSCVVSPFLCYIILIKISHTFIIFYSHHYLCMSASEMCIYTNDNFTIESLAVEEEKEGEKKSNDDGYGGEDKKE